MRRFLYVTTIIALCAVLNCAPTLNEIPILKEYNTEPEIQIRGPIPEAIIMGLFGPEKKDETAHIGLKKLMFEEQQITGEPLIAGNRVHLLKDGPQTFQAMFAAMRNARHHIHLETFIIDDETIGQQLSEILIERSRAGVEVRMVYDAIGALAAENAYFVKLRENGVQLYKFHPINPIEDIRIWRINNRHHRKIVIVDGRVGFIGGLNISDTYSLSSSTGKGSLRKGWRDTQVKVEGPGVHQLQELFVHFWAELNKTPPLTGEAYFPTLTETGSELIRTVKSKAGDNEVSIYLVYLAAIRNAQKRLWITQGYFSPDKRIFEALQSAAQRGVDVRLLLPGLTDSWVTIRSSRASYEKLLEKGVHIFERKDVLQHAKTAVADGLWSTVGSSNLDYRSFLHANEANLIIWSQSFGARMETLFLDDQAKCEEIVLQQWRQRPWLEKVLEVFSSLFDYWL